MDDPPATDQPYPGGTPSITPSTVRQPAQITGRNSALALVGMLAIPQPVIDQRILFFTI
jgi:hypothetical protein